MCIFDWQMLNKYCKYDVHPYLTPVPSRWDPMLHHTTAVLGGMPTPETSVDVWLLTSVTESPSRIQPTLSVLQWFVSKCAS